MGTISHPSYFLLSLINTSFVSNNNNNHNNNNNNNVLVYSFMGN